MITKDGKSFVGGKAECSGRKICSYGLFFTEKCLGNCSRITYTNGLSLIGEYVSAVCKVTGDSMSEYI